MAELYHKVLDKIQLLRNKFGNDPMFNSLQTDVQDLSKELISKSVQLHEEVHQNFNNNHTIEIITQSLEQSNRQIFKTQETLFNILDCISGIVYIADINEHKILYANKYLRAKAGDVVGEICYKVLAENRILPCGDCLHSHIDELNNCTGKSRKEILETFDNRWYRISETAISWFDGSLVRLEIALDITDRKLLQHSKIENELYLTKIIDCLPVGMQIFDNQGYAIRMNDKLKEMLGLPSKEETIGEFNVLTDPWVKANNLYEIYRKVFAEKKQATNEVMLNYISAFEYKKTLTKKPAFIRQSIFPILEDDGKLKCVVELITDISDRRFAQTEAANSEIRHRIISGISYLFSQKTTSFESSLRNSMKLIVSNTSIGYIFIYLYNPEQTISYLTYSWSELSIEDVTQHRVSQHDWTIVNQEITNKGSFVIKNNEEIRNFYLRIPGISDSQSLLMLPLTRETTTIGYIGFADLSMEEVFIDSNIAFYNTVANLISHAWHRKEINHLLQLKENRWNFTLNASNLGVWDWNLTKNKTYFSPSWNSILGYDVSSKTESFYDAFKQIHPDEMKDTMILMEKHINQKSSMFEHFFRMKHAEGEYLWILAKGQVVTNQETKDEHFLGIITDIHQTILLQEELLKSKQEAERASRVKSEFLANMSHEFRTPLNAMLGFTQLMRKEKDLYAANKESLDTIIQSGEHLMSLINDILDISKIESSRMVLDMTTINLSKLLKNIVDTLSIRANEKGLTIQLITEHLPDFVISDEVRIRQILFNLLSNAVKYTNKGTITIEAKTKEQIIDEKTKYLIQFVVSDTGVGIPEEKHEEIFVPFTQLKIGSVRSDGTGLGLSITRQLISMMQGELTLESKLGEGSKFSFTLQMEKASVVTPKEELDIIGYEGERIRLMVVDNEMENVMMLESMLQSMDFEVDYALDGNTAIKKCLMRSPALLILDLMMPDMDGLETIEKIRNFSDLNDIKIIIFSANTIPETKKQCLANGAVDYLTKPINTMMLQETLQKHLQLTWIYETQDFTNKKSTFTPILKTIKIPEQSDLAALMHYTKRGDIMGIQLFVKNLSEKGIYTDFCQQILSFSKDFKIEEIEQYITQYLPE